jgi:hypothetical protein
VIETSTGKAYDFVNPDPNLIELEDIAHALGNICRFAGHTRVFYSVAEHSVLVSKLIEHWGGDESDQLAGLLHDAHEAYIWDAPTPIKPLLGEVFCELASMSDAAVARAFGLEPGAFDHELVKSADKALLFEEGRTLMKVGPGSQNGDEVPGDIIPIGYSPKTAKLMFLDRARRLGCDE